MKFLLENLTAYTIMVLYGQLYSLCGPIPTLIKVNIGMQKRIMQHGIAH